MVWGCCLLGVLMLVPPVLKVQNWSCTLVSRTRSPMAVARLDWLVRPVTSRTAGSMALKVALMVAESVVGA